MALEEKIPTQPAGSSPVSDGKSSNDIQSSSSPPSTAALNLNNVPRPSAINGHSRDITEHTASLMSLFARPAATPKTPVTPNLYRSSVGNSINLNVAGIPLMPYSSPIDDVDEMDFQRMPLIVRTTNNHDVNSANNEVYSSGSGSFISMNNSLRDTVRMGNTDATWLNMDGAGQLTSKEKDAIADVLACTPTRGNKRQVQGTGASSLLDLVTPPNLETKDYSTFSTRGDKSRLPFLKAISERNDEEGRNDKPNSNGGHTIHRQSFLKKCMDYALENACDSKQMSSTLIGAALYSLYALVFCFAEASAITRPSHPNSKESGLLAPMAMMGCVSTLITAPIVISVLGGGFPALYPCLDMFLAPFLAKIAVDIDEVLIQTEGNTESHDDMEVFLATFVALNAFGMLLSGLLCILASKVKLANLAGFLPYPVLCGFFSSVGISVWMSAFKVDTGMAVQKVLASGEVMHIITEFARHLPSFIAGCLLYNFGPKNIGYLIAIITSTVLLAYTALSVTNHTLQEAQEMGFFWRSSEVVMANESKDVQLSWGRLGPPSPLGLFFPSVLKCISWPAFANGLNNVIAMSIIYLLRCSLHAAALKKNNSNILDIISKEQPQLNCSETSDNSVMFKNDDQIKTRASITVLRVLNWYAYSLLALVLSGGFAVLPALSLGSIFARINAHTRLPQFTAMFILLAFYLSDFRLVSYVPKFTFSSLLVMAAIDLVNTWFIKSYRKITSIYEWAVIPSIVVLSLLSGMLQALGMGVCISTFIFVAQFYRSGVVKFVATGLQIRSSIERCVDDNNWLDRNGDLIQVLVLQNYLYFGNASSCFNYIGTMFTDAESNCNVEVPPKPKYVLLDLSIVTGIDTSAVDIMVEISSLCKSNSCHLLLSGIPPSVKPSLIAGGLTPSRLNHPHLSFMDDLDTSLGKAEDDLLRLVAHNEERIIKDGKKQKHQRITSMIDNGLRYALRKIDEQHGLGFASHLADLEKYAVSRELEPGELLNEEGSEYLQRGLYFIESGLIKCSVDASASLTRGRQGVGGIRRNDTSIGQMNARSGTLAKNAAIIKNCSRSSFIQFDNNIRLGRFGPGWVLGTISEFTGQDIPGTYSCITPCRVHHLAFEAIEELEIEKPLLILNLYKMLAHIMARRQEMTIGQLSTFRTIMSSNFQARPPSRRSIIAVNKAIQSSV